jgi:predicted ATP-grasp superfamily ATP-dependent carboligase
MSSVNSAPRGGLKVLLTEGSSLSARHTLYALRSGHTIDILDPNPLCQGRFSRFVRRWCRCPSFSREPEAYLALLADRLRAERYDVLFPTHDQVFLLARFRDVLRPHVGLALPAFSALARLQSKASFCRLLDELGLPQPPSTVVRSRGELERAARPPCYVKLDFSTAGSGVRYVRDRDELRRAADEFQAAGLLDDQAELVVQQPALGVQSTVQAVFQHGQLVGAHCFEARAIGVGGMSMARTSAWHPSAIEHVRTLGRHLDWHGAMFLDYFFDADSGQPQYIEANPRIGETVNALLCGLNLCELLLDVSLDRDVAPAGPTRAGVRTHSGYMILMQRAMEGANRRELLREMARSWRRRDVYADSQDELTRPRDDWWSVVPAKFISTQLLASPAAARRIVRKTVEGYSLPESAVRTMRELPIEPVARRLEGQRAPPPA